MKALIISYYWPPSGGSGVQRWMYFAKYLGEFGIEPTVISVDEKYASYSSTDESLNEKIKHVRVFKTKTLEPLRFYSFLKSGNAKKKIPQGNVGGKKKGLIDKFATYVRGNFFIPDARVGWNRYAFAQASKLIQSENFDVVITTGPPHSTHLVGLKLKEKFNVKWIADFRDPWTEVYYNELFKRTKKNDARDKKMELDVLTSADLVLTIGPSMKELLEGKLGASTPLSPQFPLSDQSTRSPKLPLSDRSPLSAHFPLSDQSTRSPKFPSVDQQSLDDQPSVGVVQVPGRNLDKVTFIYNGYDQELMQNIVVDKKQNFTVAHIGILSEKQAYMSLANGFRIAFEKNPSLKIDFVLAGNISEEVLNEFLKIKQLNTIHLGKLKHKEALELMFNVHLLTNCLALLKESKILISGKLMEYMATGNPILLIGDEEGDAAQLLMENSVGMAFDPEKIDAIANYILQCAENFNTFKSSSQNLEKFSRYQTAKELSELIKSI